MGMDVFGKNPTSKEGEYFRNNVWWWRPLWDYCCEVGGSIIDENLARSGHFNDGNGLDTIKACQLAEILQKEINDGRTAAYECEYEAGRISMPDEKCWICNGIGIRTDEIGREMKQPERELDKDVAAETGRTHGWCNGCNGKGKVRPTTACYPFSVENVRDFVQFLLDCGGFEIH